MFYILKLEKRDLRWLKLPPISGYQKFERFVNDLPATNDAAEQNVKLIQDFVMSSYDKGLRPLQDMLLS